MLIVLENVRPRFLVGYFEYSGFFFFFVILRVSLLTVDRPRFRSTPPPTPGTAPDKEIMSNSIEATGKRKGGTRSEHPGQAERDRAAHLLGPLGRWLLGV